MKILPQFFLASLLTVLPCRAEEAPPLQVFLLIGQSNMAGRGLVEAQDKVPHPRVFMLTQDLRWVPAVDPMHFDKPAAVGVGPGASFGRAVAEAHPDWRLGLVPAAFGGSALDEWKPGGKLYGDALTRARAALHDGKLAGILWHQGESDNTPDKAATYAARFLAMITQLRQDLDSPDLPVVIGELGRFVERAPLVNTELAKIPSQMSNCGLVSSEGLAEKGDHLHFTSASQRELGRRYAAAFESILVPPVRPR
jgi:hypothetical protein